MPVSRAILAEQSKWGLSMGGKARSKEYNFFINLVDFGKKCVLEEVFEYSFNDKTEWQVIEKLPLF